MEKTKQKKKSYYDKQDGINYLSNPKNLKKIRSKNLRDFCKFYEQFHLLPYKNILKGEGELINNKDLMFNFKGAKQIFMLNAINELSDLDKEVLNQVNWNSCISNRTVYDYMNTLKYLIAVDKASPQLMQHIFDKMGNCHNKTNIELKETGETK